MIGAEPLCIRFNKIDGFVRVYDGTRYLVLFGVEKYDFIYNKIRYLIGEKIPITYFISHNYVKIKVHSYDSLPLEKTLTFHNVIIHIMSVWNKDQNHHYCSIFLEKCSYQLPKDNNNK